MNTGTQNFPSVKSLNCRGKLLMAEPALVMGILNLTPDSFFDGGKFTQDSEIQARVEQMIEDGLQILDLGAVSTRPGAAPVSQEEEWKRLNPALMTIRKRFPGLIISIDTTSAAIARQSLEEGADIINDVSGGDADPGMFELISIYKAPYILMHMQGKPENMQVNPQYGNVVGEVLNALLVKALRLKNMGCHEIILDPGFGFGKTADHNYRLLNNLQLFTGSPYPVLAGFSRKSMINRVLGTRPEEALNGTTVLNTIALMKGVSILRVHDVKEAAEAVKLVAALKNAAN